MMFVDAWTYLIEHPRQFGAALWTHVSLSAAALAIAVLIAVPLGIWVAETRRAALVAINTANIGRTLPSLAVLALMMPILGTGFAPGVRVSHRDELDAVQRRLREVPGVRHDSIPRARRTVLGQPEMSF